MEQNHKNLVPNTCLPYVLEENTNTNILQESKKILQETESLVNNCEIDLKVKIEPSQSQSEYLNVNILNSSFNSDTNHLTIGNNLNLSNFSPNIVSTPNIKPNFVKSYIAENNKKLNNVRKISTNLNESTDLTTGDRNESEDYVLTSSTEDALENIMTGTIIEEDITVINMMDKTLVPENFTENNFPPAISYFKLIENSEGNKDYCFNNQAIKKFLSPLKSPFENNENNYQEIENNHQTNAENILDIINELKETYGSDETNLDSHNINTEGETENTEVNLKEIVNDGELFVKINNEIRPKSNECLIPQVTVTNNIEEIHKEVTDTFNECLSSAKTGLKRRLSCETDSSNACKKIKLDQSSFAEDNYQDASMYDFTKLIFDSQKTLDENNPNWQDINDIKTAEEYFNFVSKLWQSDNLPNPHENLTKRFVPQPPKKMKKKKRKQKASIPFSKYYCNKINIFNDQLRDLHGYYRNGCYGQFETRKCYNDIIELQSHINKLQNDQNDQFVINKFYSNENIDLNAQYLTPTQYEDMRQQDKVIEKIKNIY